jgi:hypothetical protein
VRKCGRRCCVLFVHAVVLLILLSPIPSFAADPPINEQIKSLRDNLVKASPPTLQDKAVQDSIAALLTEIGKILCDAAASKNVDCKIVQLGNVADAFVEALKSSHSQISGRQVANIYAALDAVLKLSPPNDDAGLRSAIGLAAAIASGPQQAVVSPADVAEALDKLVLALQTKITAAKPANTLSQDKLDAANTKIVEAAKNLDLIYKAFGGNTGAIRVTGAWYGDLAVIKRKLGNGGIKSTDVTDSRYCSATRAVRARCQGKSQCYEPSDSSSSTSSGDGNTNEIDGPHLCGYEPAPFAEASRKGLIVRYDCLPAEDATWSSFALEDDAIPDDPPVAAGEKTYGGIPQAPVEQGSNQAQLRNSVVASIRCQQPAPPAAAQKDKKDPTPTPSGTAGNISITISGTVPGTVTGTATPTPAPTAKPTPTPSPWPTPTSTKGPAQ